MRTIIANLTNRPCYNLTPPTAAIFPFCIIKLEDSQYHYPELRDNLKQATYSIDCCGLTYDDALDLANSLGYENTTGLWTYQDATTKWIKITGASDGQYNYPIGSDDHIFIIHLTIDTETI